MGDGDEFISLGDELRKYGDDVLYEELAQAAADQVRAEGLSSADGVNLNVEFDVGEPDVERIRTRANEILAED